MLTSLQQMTCELCTYEHALREWAESKSSSVFLATSISRKLKFQENACSLFKTLDSLPNISYETFLYTIIYNMKQFVQCNWWNINYKLYVIKNVISVCFAK